MSDEEKRVDPSDGEAYTFPVFYQWYASQGLSQHQIKQTWAKMEVWNPPELRFSQGDRVMCNVGERRLAGVVLSLNVEDPEDGELLPYVVKCDVGSTISAPSDVDLVVCRERCFDTKTELDLAKWAAPTKLNKAKPLRFSLNDAVAIRVKDDDAGFEQWIDGKILEVWPAFPGPVGEGFLQTAETAPYLVETQGNQTFYCHRDEHTLIRKPENKPRTLSKTLSKRFEVRKLDNGEFEKFDHVTMRGKRVESMNESDSE